MKTVKFISHYFGTELVMRLSDDAVTSLSKADTIGEFVDDEKQRRFYGYKTVLSDYQLRKLDKYLPGTDYFDRYEII